MRLTILALPFVFLVACRAPRAPLAPLDVLREVEVAYAAELAPQKGEDAKEQTAQRATASLDSFDHKIDAHANAPTIELRCQLVTFDERATRDLAAPSTRSSFGHVISVAEFERASGEWRARGVAEVRSTPAMTLFDGGLGSLSVGTHRSFVSGFVLSDAGAGLLGDPRIEVAHEGVSVRARSTVAPDGASVTLDFALTDTQWMQPFEERRVRLPGTTTDLALQIPVSFEQRISTVTAITPDEVLVLGGLPTKDGRSIVACIRARSVGSGRPAVPAVSRAEAR